MIDTSFRDYKKDEDFEVLRVNQNLGRIKPKLKEKRKSEWKEKREFHKGR